MNPQTRVLALRAGNILQIFNLEMKSKLNEYKSEEAIVFWKWTSVKNLAFVTATGVYHWSMETGNTRPVKVFDRHPSLQNALIINYRVDSTMKWLLLIGLAKQDDGSMRGVMQLYSVDRKVTQPIEGHAGCFVDYTIPGDTAPTTLICIAANTAQGGKLFIMEVPGNKPATSPQFQKRVTAVNFSSPQDFPVAMQSSDKHGLVYLLTRAGFLYLFDVETATLIYTVRITQETIFVTAPHESTNGMIGVNRLGQVITASVDESQVIPYIAKALGNIDVALSLATRSGLGGAEELFFAQFSRFLSEMNIQAAVKIAAEAPNNILRTPQTILRLQQLPTVPGQKPPISIYFQYLLEKGKLNGYESVELARVILQRQGGAQYIKKLFDEDKLESSEELGDMLRQFDADLAAMIYLKAGAHPKVIGAFLERGAYDKVVQYCERTNYQPDFAVLFANLVQYNPDGAVQFALTLRQKDAKTLDSNLVVDQFVNRTMIKQATAYLLEVLKGNRPEDAALQTKLLEINLLYSPPQIADKIMANQLFTHFDKKRIAQLCEKVHLYQRALENYTDISDIKRCIVHVGTLNPEWVISYFSNLSEDDVLLCMKELMISNPRQNLNICVQIAKHYSEHLTPEAIMKVFESVNSWEAMFLYLSSIINFSQDAEVHFKYIVAATRVGQYQEVERVTRESNYYDGEKAKEFLKEARLPDQWPLINVCDKHDYVQELVNYLYSNNMLKYIEQYVTKKNNLRTPVVVGALLDADANEDFVRNLVASVGGQCPVEPLVLEVEKRNRLKIILPWLEARAHEGNTEPATHNALAKIYIDTTNKPEDFLTKNQYYDSLVVGKYCERRDPHLAFVAYQRGKCDLELVELTNKNVMFKKQARYLIERQSPELWEHVLSNSNSFRRQLIDQIVQTALPESKSTEEVSSTVRAFMAADLPNELIELLDKIVLHGNSEFRVNKNLQNLLILTAIKVAKNSTEQRERNRVMDYINQLDNFEALDIANIAVGSDLFEEAFAIYKKFNFHTSAVRVLLEHIQSIERASEYADRVAVPEVWSILARAMLANTMVVEAITAFIKANDASAFQQVISLAERTETYDELIKYLVMARKQAKETLIDTELLYSYARTGRHADLEEFISMPNTAQIQTVGDRCYDEGMYEAAKILFSSINNYARLASALVKLNKFTDAVDAARKANSIRTWKEVNAACVNAKEFRLAQTAGLFIIIHADELEELIHNYERHGYFDELITLMEAGRVHDRAHMGIFTELGILYAKYRPEKLMEHIQIHWNRINLPRLIRACELHHQWAAMRFLHSHYDEYDNAIKVMIDHSPEAWDHVAFKEIIVKVTNSELYYRSILFYLEEQPKLVNDLLAAMSAKVDNERVVIEVRRAGHLPLIKPYLQNVQDANLAGVNEALNQLYIDEGDYESLRHSIDHHDNFSQIALAQKLEAHALLEFRRIASHLYKNNKRWQQSVDLSMADRLFKDAMITASDSRDSQIAEGLLKYFVGQGYKECFAACLYTCYDLIKPDVALELAWRHQITDFAMPFLVQVMREYTTRIENLEKDLDATKKKQEQHAEKQNAPPAEAPNAMVMGPGGMVMGTPMMGPMDMQNPMAMNPQMMNPMNAMPMNPQMMNPMNPQMAFNPFNQGF